VFKTIQQAAQRQAAQSGDALRVDLADGGAVLAAVAELGRPVLDWKKRGGRGSLPVKAEAEAVDHMIVPLRSA
jgi:hypothetical protein